MKLGNVPVNSLIVVPAKCLGKVSTGHGGSSGSFNLHIHAWSVLRVLKHNRSSVRCEILSDRTYHSVDTRTPRQCRLADDIDCLLAVDSLPAPPVTTEDL